MTLLYDCQDIGENGITSQGSKKYLLFAELTCSDGKHTNACNPKTGLSTKMAPKLLGNCTWDKNPIPAKRGATPSGILLEDKDKVCGTTTPSVVYKYSNLSKTWSIGEIEPGTYSDVQATVNCANYDVPPSDPCPALVANAGSDHIIELDCAGAGQALYKCKGKNEATLRPEECLDMTVVNYQGDPRPAVVECMVDGNGGNANVKLKGVAKTITGYYGNFDLGNFKDGENEFGTLCLTSSGNLTIKCEISKR